jgi:hypothetical protein
VHPFNVGVTATVPWMVAPVLLKEVKDGTLPTPLAPRPITVFVFVQVYVAPVGVLVIEVAGTVTPPQMVSLGNAGITGLGFTVML